jgi:hypothetical protein
MQIITKSALMMTLAVWTATGLPGQSTAAPTWNLPQAAAVKDDGPRTYRFVVDYNTANTKGEMVIRQRLTGDYTRGLANGEVMWKNVTEATATGATAPFAAPEKRDFMEGFHYRNDVGDTMAADFFKGFPPSAIMERNLVWDTGMIEMFGQRYFSHLKLNEPYQALSDQVVNMPNLGTFKNQNVVLEYIGRSQRNGQECAVITYQAFFNPVNLATGGMTLTGRSDYWGEIWVSLETKQIEYGTLYESVVGEIKLPGQDAAQVLNIFRSGTLEPISPR